MARGERGSDRAKRKYLQFNCKYIAVPWVLSAQDLVTLKTTGEMSSGSGPEEKRLSPAGQVRRREATIYVPGRGRGWKGS